MYVYIIRHAWAYPRDDERWPDDGQRPLTPEGIERFQHMAALMADRGCKPKAIATSPLVRCRQTADMVARCTKKGLEVDELSALAPGSDLAGMLRWTCEQGGQSVAWVGHAPDVTHLAAALIGDGACEIHFSKGSYAAIRFGGPPQIGEGELRWLASAEMLGC